MLTETQGYTNRYQGMYGLGNFVNPTPAEIQNLEYMNCRAVLYDPRMSYNSDPCEHFVGGKNWYDLSQYSAIELLVGVSASIAIITYLRRKR